MAAKIYRCYIFSEEQEHLLRSKKYKIDRMECFLTLAERALTIPTIIDISDHRQVRIDKGQLLISDVDLSRLWKIDRKTVSKLIQKMQDMKILTATKVAEVTVYSIHCLSGWYIDGVFQRNDFYLRPPKSWETERNVTIPEIQVIHKDKNTASAHSDSTDST